jgi:cellulose biosynthesis protein BcsQ
MKGSSLKSIALYSIKGGVGKTAACVNLAHLASCSRGPTLLCDIDPQGSSTFYYRIKPKTSYNSRKFLKGGKKLEKAIRATDFEKLDLLPADFSYRNMDLELNDLSKSRMQLRRLLGEFDGEYRTVFIDCPPNMTLVSENVFEAADVILVPLIPTTLSLLTYRKLEDFFLKSGLDSKKLRPFFSMVEPRKQMHRQVIRDIVGSGVKVLKSYIPYSAEVEKMGFYRAPLTSKRSQCSASIAFKKLWDEIDFRILKR